MSIVTSESFKAGEQDHSPDNDNFDFCQTCWKEGKAENYLDSIGVEEDATDSQGREIVSMDTEHPPYGEYWGYDCVGCRVRLIDDDN